MREFLALGENAYLFTFGTTFTATALKCYACMSLQDENCDAKNHMETKVRIRDINFIDFLEMNAIDFSFILGM